MNRLENRIFNKSWDLAMKIFLAFVFGLFCGYFWFALQNFARELGVS